MSYKLGAITVASVVPLQTQIHQGKILADVDTNFLITPSDPNLNTDSGSLTVQNTKAWKIRKFRKNNQYSVRI